jgi:two-component system nitrogen regulation sensor histidine kinase GlnL
MVLVSPAARSLAALTSPLTEIVVPGSDCTFAVEAQPASTSAHIVADSAKIGFNFVVSVTKLSPTLSAAQIGINPSKAKNTNTYGQFSFESPFCPQGLLERPNANEGHRCRAFVTRTNDPHGLDGPPLYANFTNRGSPRQYSKMDLWHEILDCLHDAVIVLSPTLDPLAVNAAAEATLEASQVNRPMIGRLIRRNDWLRRMIGQCLHTGQSLDNPEATLMLDNRSLAVRAEVSPLTSPAGYFEGAILVLHDLSYQKNAEQTFDSDENAFRLSPAGLAHEVKNPLTGIKGAAELLAAMFPSDQRAKLYCGLILEGVNRIAGLVEQVLAASNPQRLKREPFNIHQVLHQALRMAGLFPGASEHFLIEQDFDPSLPEVVGDAVALERVFLNLIRNAREAIEALRGTGPSMLMGRAETAATPALSDARSVQPSARGVIRLRTAMETQFRISAHGKRRQYLRVELSDTGMGMSEAELKQLFTPFYTTKPSGTGLGLVLSRRIVGLHGGKLWAERGGMRPRGSPRQDRTATRRRAEDRNGDGALNSSTSVETQPRGMTFYVMLPVGPE